MSKLTTKRLRNGKTVLARQTESGPEALTYSNLTQARSAADKARATGATAFVFGNRPFYVAVADADK